jgi:hypothetical protein
MFGLCDAIWFAFFLSRLADNKICAEGAGRLAEPLGKLTALQKLDLRGTACCVCFLMNLRDDVCLDSSMRFGLLCF